MTTPETIRRHPLYQKVSAFVISEHLLDGIDYLDVALSGGADSVCLIALLSAMTLPCALRAHHVRHHLRDDDRHDAEIAQKVAQTLGIEYIQTDLVWTEHPESDVENEARKHRYDAFFNALSSREHCGIALAHHGDENVETAIWRLGRGCGLEGFGMKARTARCGISLIRPLLTISKDEIYAFLRDTGLEWAEDPTNQSDDFRRNRIRHTILPQIKAESMSELCLYRSLYQIRRDADALDSLTESFVASRPVRYGGWFCSWEDWNRLDRSAQAQVLRHAARHVVEGHCPSSQIISKAISMAEQKKETFRKTEDGRIAIGWSHGGIMVWNERENTNLSPIKLEIPCTDFKLWHFCELTAFVSVPESALKNTTSIFHVDASCAEGELTIVPANTIRDVRNSVGNITRLREALRGQGVPDMWRGHWPVLCCDGRPLWVLGGMRTVDARPAEPGKRAITFMVRWL